MPDERLTIGALAAATGVATSALRYWEQLGLLPAPPRVAGRRRFPASTVRLVGMVLLLRDVGFTLNEIRTLLAARADDPEAWQELYRRKLAELDERISQAQVARTAIAHALARPHPDGIAECPRFTAGVTARLAGLPLHEAHAH